MALSISMICCFSFDRFGMPHHSLFEDNSPQKHSGHKSNA